MKRIIIFLLFSISVCAQNIPIAGKTFVVNYNPSEKNIFTKESKITLVYTFDQWGTKYTYFDGMGLFQNVLEPDEGQKHEIKMTFINDSFTADIFIPDSAQLLSYYITDGDTFDYNDKKTYTSYIYNDNRKPVKGARFRNVDFLIMAGAEPEEYIAELEKEIADYPDYHLARAILWSKKMETSETLEKILLLRDEFEKKYSELKKKYPDDFEFMNAEARGYFAFQVALSNILSPHYQYAYNKMLEIAELIPDGKRSSILERIYQQNINQQKYNTFKDEIIGKPLIDFEFITIAGEVRKLSDYKGKTVLIDFWGTWCGPCVGEIPNLLKVYNKYKEEGFEIVSISSDLMMNSKTNEEFESFVEEKNMSWVIVLDDKKGTIHNLYKVNHWPTLFLIDKNGIVIKNESVLRGASLEETLEGVMLN